jgi:hypothetical protein
MRIRGLGVDALADLKVLLSALKALPEDLRRLESMRQDIEAAVARLEEVEAHLRTVEKVIPPAVLKLLAQGMSSPSADLRSRTQKVLADLHGYLH